ncbi:MAG: major capsid protein [Arizlama microvirus]|nr:MAG: major capsid protein [Arizlama microvirus]
MKRNKFSLSHYKLLSCDQGKLIPIGVQEVIPGDTFQHSTKLLIRTAPLLAPIMHPVRARVHHFFVPYRLIWDDFEDFITGGQDGTEAPVHPYTGISVQTPAIGTLGDYLGCNPCNSSNVNMAVSALPYRAYNLIWNEYYRDADLGTPVTVNTASGLDTTTNFNNVLDVCWEKDYFTTSRPDPQKGADVTIPMSGTAKVKGVGSYGTVGGIATTNNVRESDGTTRTYTNSAVQGVGFAMELDSATGATTRPTIYADLNTNTGATINELREAFAVQRFEEARSRWGSRYVEYLRYLGVKAEDSRLQRPEYLGGGTQTIQFSEVLQTGEGTDPVGTLRGHGISAMSSNRYRRFFQEHGFVITMMSVIPKSIYADSIPRHWFKHTKFDYHTKEFEHIGQQPIWAREVYPSDSTTLTDQVDWSYQDRYDEYRRAFSQVHGEFRTTLNYWHFARIFSSAPTLNNDFVKAVPTTRTYASTSTDPLYIMASHSIQARRPISASGGNSYAL